MIYVVGHLDGDVAFGPAPDPRQSGSTLPPDQVDFLISVSTDGEMRWQRGIDCNVDVDGVIAADASVGPYLFESTLEDLEGGVHAVHKLVAHRLNGCRPAAMCV